MNFSNASEFGIFQQEHCRNCHNWRERTVNHYNYTGCPVVDNLILHSDKMINETVREVYAEFLYWNDQEQRCCSMFLPREGGE